MKKKTFLYLLFLFALLFGLVQLTEAAPPQQIEPPILPPLQEGGVKIEYQRVNVTIEDQIATTHIDQLFVNEHDWMLEGTYLFPLPANATVSELTMWVDGVAIESKILPKEEARAIYDEIVRQLRDPALLEYVGTQAIQANVFPIPAHAERRIEIEYTQVLPAENGILHYVYPQSTNLYTNIPLDSQSIRVELQSNEAIHALYSPSHRVDINRTGDFHAVVGYEDSNVIANEDFELYYTVTPEDIGLNLLSYKEAEQDGFFLLLVSPSVIVDEQDVVAKDVIVVMDTSGSMEGEKMAQAKEAARYVVDHLNPQDRFNIISFATGTRQFASELTPVGEADPTNFINSLEAIGGTNISLALLEAVQQGDEARPLTIIFLTDGLATEGIVETPLLLNTIQQEAPNSTRLFAFGVGDDVDTLLLDSLTESHRGTTTYVRPSQAIDEEVSAFYAKVSTPVLADIEINYDGVVVEQIYPDTLPDLFAGTQLIIAGRYREGAPATITLRGDVNGETQIFVYEDNLFRTRGGDDFIPRLWATRAIGHLLNEIRLHGEDPELVQSVINLSVRYGIITPYTSYLIEEDDILTQTGRDDMMEEVMIEVQREVEVSGAAAVEEAEMFLDLADADMGYAPPTTIDSSADGNSEPSNMIAGMERVQYVGSKTFILQNGIWTDTAFDAEVQTPQEVGFATDTYFDLLSSAPELGQYLALGEHVLVMYDGMAYEIVSGTGDDNVTLPINNPEPDSNTITNTNPVATQTPFIDEGNDIISSNNNTGYVVAGIVGLFLLLGVGIALKQRK